MLQACVLTHALGVLPYPAVEVILAAPGKVTKEEQLYVQKRDFGKVWGRQGSAAGTCDVCLSAQPCRICRCAPC
jgi:hypothetical protein